MNALFLTIIRTPGVMDASCAVLFVAAAALAYFAGLPPRQPRRAVRYAIAVSIIALANVALTIAAARRPHPATEIILSANSVLLVYAAHRRSQRTAHPTRARRNRRRHG